MRRILVQVRGTPNKAPTSLVNLTELGLVVRIAEFRIGNKWNKNHKIQQKFDDDDDLQVFV